nr:LamG domain-containing protein [Kitasatospora sp. SID7827]
MDGTTSVGGSPNGYAETRGTVLDTTRGFTVSAWVNLTEGTRNRTAVSQIGTHMSRFALGMMNDQWRMWTTDKDAEGFAFQLASSTAPVVYGQWTHLTGVYDPAAQTYTLYVNGVAGTPVASAAAWQSSGPLEIGRSKYRGAMTDPWKGSVDDVKVWDRALGAADVARVATDQPVTTGRGAKAAWSFDGTAANPVGAGEADALTLSGGALPGQTGPVGKAVHFDGVDDYARGTRPQVDGSRDFSVSAWVRLSKPAAGDTAAKVAVSQTGQYAGEFTLYYSTAWNQWVFGRYKEDSLTSTLVSARQPDCAPGTVTNGVPCFAGATDEWVHLIGVSDSVAKKTRLYVNGYPVGESDYTQTAPWAAPGPVQLGAGSRSNQNLEYFKGDIGEVRLYDRVVTSAEAAAMVQQNPQLIGRWKLDSATGTPATAPEDLLPGAGATLGGDAAIHSGGGILTPGGTLALDGSGDYAATGTLPLHTNQSFTLAGWVNTAGVPDRDMTVLSVAGTNNSAVVLRWHSKGLNADYEPYGEWQAEVRDGDGSGAVRTTATHSRGSQRGGWIHLAVTYDAFTDRLVLYVNGVPQNQTCAGTPTDCVPYASDIGAPQPYEGGGALQFGRSRQGGGWAEDLSGELDDVWAFQNALTVTQVLKLAAGGNALDSRTGI